MLRGLMISIAALLPILFAPSAEAALKPPRVVLETAKGKNVLELYPERRP